MINMRTLAFVCWILVFQSIIIARIVHAQNRHRRTAVRRDVGDLKDIAADPRSRLSLLHRSSVTNVWLFRNKRNERVEEKALPTRHGKHRRKRRRCRNRSSCLRGPLPPGQRTNETKEYRDASNAMIETEDNPRERSEGIDRVQDLYNETKVENYNVTGIDEEKSRIATKGSSIIIADKNTFEDDYLTDSEQIDSYDDLSTYGEDEPGKDRSKKDEIYLHPSIVYSPIDDQIAIHESLSVLLSKLFQSLRNTSTVDNRDILRELNFVNGSNEDPCQKWLNSKDKLEQVFLGGLASLPACPCQYPSNIFYDDKIWDERQKRYFRWRDVSGDSQRLDVYKPGAAYCVRSLLTQESGSVAAQHCCYDRGRKLLTRGSGAGTPYFVSPEISPILHERIDVLPWRLCKGDFSRYNGVRPPNNDNGCQANPDNEEYQRQFDNTKYY